MRHLAKLIGLSAIVAAFVAPAAAHAGTVDAASHQKVDGTITVSDVTCSWTNADTSANPPTTLTIFRDTVNPPGGNLSCSGASVTLNNDPVVSFDDGAGTATVDQVDVTGTRSGVTCRYRATNITLQREGTTRNYSGSGFTAHKVSGSWFCPSSASGGAAAVSFH